MADNANIVVYDEIQVVSLNSNASDVPVTQTKDVVTNGDSTDNNSSNNSTTGSQYSLYIGNITWWTTDQDVSDCIKSIGVSDIIEVKIFEDGSSGASKGFCVVTLGSEHSLRLVRDELPKKELNEKSPVVSLPTQKAFLQFELNYKSLLKRSMNDANNENEPLMDGMSRTPGQNMQQPMTSQRPMMN